MTSLADLLQQSAAHAWLFVPTAILLGALHGLEPGHSKTMMAAFIIAVRGTVRQAVLLGLAATLSHTVVVWVVALGGMWLFGGLNAEATEPYFQLASGVLIVVIAAWMLWRTRREQIAAEHYHHDHGHHHGHSHGHGHNHHGDHDHHEHEEFEEAEERGLEVATGGFVDAHEMAHAEDIRRRFANSNVTKIGRASCREREEKRDADVTGVQTCALPIFTTIMGTITATPTATGIIITAITTTMNMKNSRKPRNAAWRLRPAALSMRTKWPMQRTSGAASRTAMSPPARSSCSA